MVLCGIVALLLVVNANRRHRHRAELAELRMQRDQEVIAGIKAADSEVDPAKRKELWSKVLKRIADRHFVIEKGRTVWRGSSADLDRDAALVHRYVTV